ncbi:hypothetical protein BDV25DRAFT_141604 [Aspergillus avenaceus]|uniref:Nonribosomal peptide synthetase aveC n=1 Tax=Aspergillus avenaceus TaxID=36643 RepID=AVEC_ASPAV|nr:hypothetical protein BDV25DRAFT_141604 [Aspergillus avenaceus]
MPYTPADCAIKHGKSLQDLEPCLFTGRSDEGKESFQQTTVELGVNDEAIQRFCSRHSVSSCRLFQAVWAIVINRYAGVEDVLFGYSANNERVSSSGYSEDLHICHVHITSEAPLVQTMLDMMTWSDDAWKQCNGSITEVQRLVGLENGPLFNSALQVRRHDERPMADLKDCDILAEISTTDDAGISVNVSSYTPTFCASQTAGIAHTFGKTLLEILKAHPDCTVGDLDLISQYDREIVMEWNNTMPNGVDRTFHQHFEHVVQRMPDAEAICSWDGIFTYQQLDSLSTRLSNQLVDLGVEAEKQVLICFDKSAFAIVSMLGIMKAGGAFVAIDPSYPASRIQSILHATHASIAVADPAHCHLFEGMLEHILPLDASSAETLPAAPKTARSPSSPSNAAYVVFTSGSTGSPKGIIVEHRALCTAALSLANPMRIGPLTRHLNFAMFTFDLSYGDIFVTLSQGACLCLPSEHERTNDLSGAMVRMNVNSACLIPSVARIFHPDDVPCLETLSLGGEALLKENIQVWARRVALNNMYGPSECTIWCCSNTNLKHDSPANNIGRGVGALLWIASPTNHNHLCPIGCIGELLIEGPVMARGYTDAEQTQKCFIENPRWAPLEPGQRRRYYKTGDLARYNPDGTVSFLGRKDTQVKFHGRRIELGEIEYHLASHNNLRQSMTIVPSVGVYAQKLVAIVVMNTSSAPLGTTVQLQTVEGSAREDALVQIEKIKHSLSSKVPHYMIPQFWIVVEDIPLMISGKMNRVLARKFVESMADMDGKAKVGNEPQIKNKTLEGPLEVRLRQIWASILDAKATEITADQTFASLGGDSFSAMELVASCRKQNLAITVGDCFEDVTIRKMASIVQERMSGTRTTADGHSTQLQTTTKPSHLGSVHIGRTLKLAPAWWDIPPALSTPA